MQSKHKAGNFHSEVNSRCCLGPPDQKTPIERPKGDTGKENKTLRNQISLKDTEKWSGCSPECGIVVVVLDGDGLHLWPSVSNEPSQLLRHLLRFLVHWGGDFKQPISTGTQFKLLTCPLSVYCKWRDKRGKGQQVGNVLKHNILVPLHAVIITLLFLNQFLKKKRPYYLD